jgi:hypothetical protein
MTTLRLLSCCVIKSWEFICRLDISVTLVDWSELQRTKEFSALCYSNKSEGVVVRLYLSTLHSRRWHLHALFLISVFKSKISCSSFLSCVCLHTPTGWIRDCCIVNIHCHFKVIPQLCFCSWCNPQGHWYIQQRLLLYVLPFLLLADNLFLTYLSVQTLQTLRCTHGHCCVICVFCASSIFRLSSVFRNLCFPETDFLGVVTQFNKWFELLLLLLLLLFTS